MIGYDPTRYTGSLAPWIAEIVTWHQQGMRRFEIADRLLALVRARYPKTRWIHEATVTYALDRVGVINLGLLTFATQQHAAQVLILRRQGLSLAQIGGQLGRSRERVRQLLQLALKHEQVTARRDRWQVRELDAWLGPNKGRPLDMGGPRDRWLEQSPWDER